MMTVPLCPDGYGELAPMSIVIYPLAVPLLEMVTPPLYVVLVAPPER
jgi:hypothetical protein